MAEPTTLTPIELTDAELDAVSGGQRNFVGISQSNSNKTKQSIKQSIKQTGGGVTIGDDPSGATANSGNISVSEYFSAYNDAYNYNTTTQTNTNSGSVTGAI
jgi:hypothetical protein